MLVKIHELAKKLNANSKEILEKAKALKIDVKSHLSSISEEEANKIEEAMKKEKEEKEVKEKYIDIIRLMISNKYITQEEIGKKLNKTKNAVYRNIKTLRDLNIIQRVNATNGGYWKVNL